MIKHLELLDIKNRFAQNQANRIIDGLRFELEKGELEYAFGVPNREWEKIEGILIDEGFGIKGTSSTHIKKLVL